MKTFCLKAALVAVAIACGLLVGQEAKAQQRAAYPVAILDLPYIFKNHARFQAMSADLRRDLQTAEDTVKASRESIQRMAQRLEDYNKGTPEYKQLEEEIARRSGEVQAQMQIYRKDFVEKEARIYYEVYQEVMDRVKYYAEANGIVLVLQFNGNPIDPNDPQAVVKGLGKDVLYHHPQIDITPIILDQLNPGQRPMTQPAPVGAAPRPQGVFPPR